MEIDTSADQRQDLFGVSFDPLTMTQAIDRCRVALQEGDYLSIGVVNAAKVMTMRRDSQLREAVSSCEMLLADGQGLKHHRRRGDISQNNPQLPPSYEVVKGTD